MIKKYLAICYGQLTKNLNISGYITHDELTMKMKFSLEPHEQSKNCSTIFIPIFNTKDFTLVECQLVTGRKHQIRSTLQFFKDKSKINHGCDKNKLIKRFFEESKLPSELLIFVILKADTKY
ncbi:MAG: pseudouridine synthase [Rickettsia endosymbiont of Ixodes persulcatus]|nr:pseudouridine synthase [Rickettsia endosymbiont of Ixodes persulcatus]